MMYYLYMMDLVHYINIIPDLSIKIWYSSTSDIYVYEYALFQNRRLPTVLVIILFICIKYLMEKSSHE